MASQSQSSYLTAELTLPEEETLGFSATHGNIGEINKPPGIHTLEEWGQIRAPSGKYPGSTFAEIFQKDQVYVQHMWNRRGVSSWVRSFQMYCRAVRKLEPSPDHHRGYQAPVAPKSMSRSKPPTTVTGEWTKIEKTGEAMKTTSKGENKRSMQEPKNEMLTETNPERVEVLRTQIAIMQRELEKELNSSNSAQSSGPVLENN
jgi:hypothetical protein